MFKGLKSKLEDQGKKLQASVASYGEQLSEQIGSIRTATSDAGSDSGSNITRRFLNVVGGNSSPAHPNLEDSLTHSVGSALMEEVTEGDLLGLDLPKRERRLSGGSTHSNESSFSSFFQSVPGMAASTLEDIDSDRESTLDEHGSAVVRSASKEQISSVLSKLQGRAANYKDKYRDLVKKYNEVVTENNKCRTVLAQTQDKALERMEKLRGEKKTLNDKILELENSQHESPAKVQKYEQLLEKCKAEITKNKEKIKELMAENESLRSWNDNNDGETEMSDLAAERISSEWKQRIDKVEGEWTERLNSVESNYIDQIAAAKKETFVVMESKDKEIESLRTKCRELEIQDGQANDRWQKKVDELQSIVKALETEKTDMVEKLSAAKAQGVQAVRDEEEIKRNDLIAELTHKAEQERIELEAKHEEALDFLKTELTALKSTQHEEVDAMNAVKATEHNLEVQLAELEERLRVSELKLTEQKEEMDGVLDSLNVKHREEIAALIQEHEELVVLAKQQGEVERTNLTDMISFLEKDLENVRSSMEKSQKDSDSHQQNVIDELSAKETKYKEDIERLENEIADLTKKHSIELSSSVESHQKEISLLYEKLDELRETLEQTSIDAQQFEDTNNTEKKNFEEELRELRSILQERNEHVHRLETEKSELEVELAQSRELSAIHEHLRSELEEARKQKEEAETKLFELEKFSNGGDSEELIKLEGSAPVEAVSSAEINELKAQLDELKLERSQLEEQLMVVSKERESLIQKNALDGNSLQSYEMQIASLKSSSEEEKSQLVKRLDSLRAETTQVIADLTKRADEAEDSVAQTSKEKKQVEEELTLLKEQFAQLAQRLSSLEESKNDRNSAAETIREELKQSTEEKRQLEEHLSKARDELEVALKSAKEVAMEKEKFENDTEEKQKLREADIASLLEMKDNLEGNMAKLQQQLDLANKQNSDLQNRLIETAQIEALILEKQSKVDELEKESKSKLEDLSSHLLEKEELVEKFRTEAQSLKEKLLQNEENQKTSETAKIRDLEELNERMRVEFIAKEKILAELRTQLDGARDTANFVNQKNAETVEKLEVKLKKAASDVENAAGTIDSLRQALAKASELKKEEEGQWEKEKEENTKIRDQYSIALENLKTELADAHQKITNLSSLEADKADLSKKIAQLTEDLRQKEEEFLSTKESLESEWKMKVEKSVQKQKKISEDEASAAKAEFMLNIDNLRGDVADKEKKLDSVVLEKARLEQELIALNAVREELDEKKDKEKQLANKLSEIEHRLMELEAENKVLGVRKADLEEAKENLASELERHKLLISEKENEVKNLTEMNEDTMRKAVAKQDTDSKKVIRELQREVKQLYVELNEKSEAVDRLKKQLDEQKASSSEAVIVKQSNLTESAPQKDFMYEEELETMRNKLKDSHKEIDELRDLNGRLERSLESSKKTLPQKTPNPPKTNGTASNYDIPAFADSAEAEYLKNVLYRYMADRETLGHESVTLARVIGTVAKFNKSQMDSVVAKEESRLAGWVGGTVAQMSHALSGVRQ